MVESQRPVAPRRQGPRVPAVVWRLPGAERSRHCCGKRPRTGAVRLGWADLAATAPRRSPGQRGLTGGRLHQGLLHHSAGGSRKEPARRGGPRWLRGGALRDGLDSLARFGGTGRQQRIQGRGRREIGGAGAENDWAREKPTPMAHTRPGEGAQLKIASALPWRQPPPLRRRRPAAQPVYFKDAIPQIISPRGSCRTGSIA